MYANSILMCQSAAESDFLSPLTRAVTLNMPLLKRGFTHLSNFLWAFCRDLSTSKEVPFQFNTQQDVPEILQVVFDEQKGYSTIASKILATSVETSSTCDTCCCCNIQEVKLDIIPLPQPKSISLSLDRFLSSECLTGDSKWFCPACNGFMGSRGETKTVDSGSLLILELLCYDNFKGAVIKNNMRVNWCSETLRLPFSADGQVCLFKEFNLKATINHSGNLQASHYWVHIKEEDNCGWLKCNDTSVIATPFSVLSNSSSYVFFYAATHIFV